MNENNDSLLVAEYALGLLDRAEAATFKKRLQKESVLRADLISWSEHFAVLYERVEEVTPPPGLKAAIFARIFAEPQQASPKSSLWLRPLNWMAGLVLVSLIGFIGLIFYQSQLVAFQADYIANLQTEDQSLQVVASYDETRQLLQVASTQSVPAIGRSHELWLIAGDNPPVSLGVLKAINNEKMFISDELSTVIIGSTLAISDEPSGGSPTGSPTGAVLTTAVIVEM